MGDSNMPHCGALRCSSGGLSCRPNRKAVPLAFGQTVDSFDEDKNDYEQIEAEMSSYRHRHHRRSRPPALKREHASHVRTAWHTH